MLGFIKRSTKDFTDTKALTIVYNCLVRSVLEYCSVIWSPFYRCHVARLERVQGKFVKYLLSKLRFPYGNVSHETRLLLCGFQSLEIRRRGAFLLFLYKLLRGTISCDSLLRLVSFNTTLRVTRGRPLFRVQTHRTNYGTQTFVDRLMWHYNRYFCDCDIQSLSLPAIQTYIRQL